MRIALNKLLYITYHMDIWTRDILNYVSDILNIEIW